MRTLVNPHPGKWVAQSASQYNPSINYHKLFPFPPLYQYCISHNDPKLNKIPTVSLPQQPPNTNPSTFHQQTSFNLWTRSQSSQGRKEQWILHQETKKCEKHLLLRAKIVCNCPDKYYSSRSNLTQVVKYWNAVISRSMIEHLPASRLHQPASVFSLNWVSEEHC